MHISATTTALPHVPVRSNAGRFERDGGLQCQNTWQNRDLRPILPLEPTGLDGTRPQPPTVPADLHGGCYWRGWQGPMCPQQGGAGWEMATPPQNMHFSLVSDLPKTPLGRFFT